MKIALIGQKGMPARYGGVEQHVHNLAIRLVKAGHEVVAYNRPWYSGKAEEFEGVKIKSLPSLKTKHFDTITHVLLSTLHAITQDFDVIHYHGVGPSLLSWIPRLFTPRVRVINTFHSIDRHHQKWGFFAKIILRLGEKTACWFAHKTITISESLNNYCLNEFNNETTFIPNGIEIGNKEILDNELINFGLEKNNYLVMVSRLVPHKGAHTLIASFHELKRKYANDARIKNLKLAIVGGSVYTDQYIKNLHYLASGANDIVFTDFQTGEVLEQLYANALALVHPSMNEGLPITVLQAMSYARPVILSRIPEHMEILHDTSFMFEKNNIESLLEQIYKFLSLPEKEKKMVGDYNRRIVENKYSWDIVVPEIIKVYKKEKTLKSKVYKVVKV